MNAVRRHYLETGFVSRVPILDERECEGMSTFLNEWDGEDGIPFLIEQQQDLHLRFEPLWRVLSHRKLLEFFTNLLGEPFSLLGSKLRCRHPREDPDRAVPWHQDGSRWKITPAIAHTAWIALDDNTLENGCLWVVPRSHRDGFIQHDDDPSIKTLRHKSCVRSVEERLPEPVPIVIKAGEMCVFHSQLLHSSQPNLSDHRRCTVLARYATNIVSTQRDYGAIPISAPDVPKGFHRVDVPFPALGSEAY